MPTTKTIYKKILIWRYKYISERQFVYILSVLVGFLAGIGAVVLKNLTHFFQHLLEGNLVRYYHNAFYFLFPIIGLAIVYFVIKYIIRKKVNHGIPSTLFAISKKHPRVKLTTQSMWGCSLEGFELRCAV